MKSGEEMGEQLFTVRSEEKGSGKDRREGVGRWRSCVTINAESPRKPKKGIEPFPKARLYRFSLFFLFILAT
jgi:hypothetical protein